MISRITKTAAAASAFALMSSAAYAGCGDSMYCSSSSHGHSASSVGYSGATGSVTMPGTFDSGSVSYGGSVGSVTMPGTFGSNYGGSSSYGMGGSVSDSYADATYGTGSISGAYIDSASVGSTYTSSSVSSLSIPGLGASERLCPTSCDTGINVHGSNGNRVLGCYKVCQPVQVAPPVRVQNYVRVVRPIVYVRYPVPVPVAVPACGPTWSARYLDHGSRRCGW